MIDFIGNFSISGVTDATSISILKTIAWMNFALLFLLSVPVFLIYSIIIGSKDDNKTSPMDILKGIGIWLITSPFGLLVYVIVAIMISSLNTATNTIIVSGDLTTIGQFSWLIALISILAVNIVPYYYILKGYGQLGGENV